jgi:Zn-dependent protease with chaperone function
MHTQAESDRLNRPQSAVALSAVTGLLLYLLTLAGEVMLGAAPRWLLAYLGALALGTIVSLGPAAGQLAWIAALAPLAWSALSLVRPGNGWIWRRRLGVRRPTASETLAIEDACQILRSGNPRLRETGDVYVLDDPLSAAAARGCNVIFSRGLLETDSVPAVYAHELGHTNSLDARLTEALERLELWGEPLGPVEPQRGVEAPPVADERSGGLLLGCARWALRLTGGGCAEAVLRPLWCAYWRRREYAADAYAASLGQAEDLACYLTEQELPFDPPQRRLLFNRAEHPPVAFRIERLRRLADTAEAR